MSLLDIHSRITFESIAPLLNLEPVTQYSNSAKCPYCRANSWTVGYDNCNLEEWYYCSQCNASGTIVAMAADLLGLSTEEALSYLCEKLSIPLPLEDVIEFRGAITWEESYSKLWEYTQLQTKHPEDDQKAWLASLGWSTRGRMSPERYEVGPGKLYGVCDARTIIDVTRKKIRKTPPVALVPFYKSPRRIGGFVGLSTERISYIRGPQRLGNLAGGEFGFAGLQFLEQLGNQDLILTDLIECMVKLQVKNFANSWNPLPILGWNTADKNASLQPWSLLSGRNLVFWCREPSAKILEQAIRNDAKISFVGPAQDRDKPVNSYGDRWKSWLRDQHPSDAVDLIRRTAKPCRQALANWARRVSPERQITLLRSADNLGGIVASTVREAMHKTHIMHSDRTIRISTATSTAPPRLTTGGQALTVVVEKDGQWLSREGTVRFPGIVRVTHLVVRPSDRHEYVGQLEMDGKQIPFKVAKEEATLEWLINYATKHELAVSIDSCFTRLRGCSSETFNPFEAAMKFELPTVVKGLDNIGWDGSGFQFKGAKLSGGSFNQNPDFKFPDKVPGPRQRWSRMSETTLASMSRESPAIELCWAMCLALSAQVTAPATDLDIPGIFIKRPKNDASLSMLLRRFHIPLDSSFCWNHNWPRYIKSLKAAIIADDGGFFVTSGRSRPRLDNMLCVDACSDISPRDMTTSVDTVFLQHLRMFTSGTIYQPRDLEDWVDHTYQAYLGLFPSVNSLKAGRDLLTLNL